MLTLHVICIPGCDTATEDYDDEKLERKELQEEDEEEEGAVEAA